MLRPLLRTDLDQAKALLAASCDFDRAAQVADEVLFGPAPAVPEAEALGAYDGEHLIGVVAHAGKWLRVLAVHPQQRGRGIGTALLAAAERAIAGRGYGQVRVLDQPGNYLAPGVDVRNREVIDWLCRRGYTTGAERVNLLVDVAKAQARRQAAQSRLAPGYAIRRAQGRDRDALLAWIEAAFSPAWAFEVDRALGCEPPAVHVALTTAPSGDTPAIAAFAAHDGNNQGLGWFGPAGTAPAHRGLGLGAVLLHACIDDIAAAGHPVCEVAWIGPRDFYERAAGIAGERRFVAMTKELL